MLYNVFNPLTGQNTQCETKQDAVTLALEISRSILDRYHIVVNSINTDENGDQTWSIDYDIVSSITVDSSLN